MIKAHHRLAITENYRQGITEPAAWIAKWELYKLVWRVRIVHTQVDKLYGNEALLSQTEPLKRNRHSHSQ